MRIGHLVEHHEAGVDGDGAPGAGFGGGDGVGVAAGVVVLLEEREVEVPLEKMGAAESGDTGADDGERGHEAKKREAGNRRDGGTGRGWQGAYVRGARADEQKRAGRRDRPGATTAKRG